MDTAINSIYIWFIALEQIFCISQSFKLDEWFNFFLVAWDSGYVLKWESQRGSFDATFIGVVLIIMARDSVSSVLLEEVVAHFEACPELKQTDLPYSSTSQSFRHRFSKTLDNCNQQEYYIDHPFIQVAFHDEPKQVLPVSYTHLTLPTIYSV